MLMQIFEEQAARRPDKIAVKAGDSALTYRFLDDYAERLAQVITGTCAAHHKERMVALLLGHNERMITGIMAALKANSIYIPFDPSYPLERLAYMLKDSGAALIVTDSENFQLAVKLNGFVATPIAILNLDDLDEYTLCVDGTRRIETDPNQIAYILYTSGSTGKPKGVVQNQRNILYYIRNWTRLFSLTGTDRIAQFASFCHDGSIPDLYSALLNGATLYPFDIKRNPRSEEIARWIIAEEITIWHSVPTWYRYFVNTINAAWEFRRLRFVVLGGEMVREHDIIMFNKFFPYSRFGNIYGQTESTVNSIWQLSPGDPFREVLIGQPLAETQVAVVDNEGDEVNEFEAGEIVVAADYLSPGYLNSCESTHKAFSFAGETGSLYWTGDLGRRLPGGNIEILGRKDHQVKVRGFRIEPGEIETVLLQHPHIHETVVTARESDGRGAYGAASGDNYLCAYFVSDRDFTVSQLREYLAGKLPDYMIPTYFVKLDAMPLTPNGKIDRKSLDAHGVRLSTGVEYTSPGNEIETQLITAWKKVLKLDKIGIDDNFFDLGGNSMDVIVLNNELKKVFGRDIPVIAIFRYFTVRSFARYLTTTVRNEQAHPPQTNEQVNRVGGRTGPEIAVIGMSGRFPGARDIHEFWKNLTAGVESITFFTTAELEEAGVPPELLNNPNYVKAKPLLEDIQYFDASFFNYIPKEAAVMDPQIRIFHECVYHALEDAGYDPFSYEKPIGLYAGASVNFNWLAFNLLSPANRDDAGQFEARSLYDKEFICTRISHKLNLKGPAVLVQTACSTSLVAVHMACRALLEGECTIALAGGVSVPYMKKEGYLYREGAMLSSDGHCKVFDARSDGTIFGNGVGAVALKSLQEAIADGDHIYALIKGSAINNDGLNRGGFTAPSIEGEAECIRSALKNARVNPETISYIETHSTGTALGGPIEFEALKLAFQTSKKRYCALGCVKTNLGHLNMASGITGFIKTILALKYRMIPPTLHYVTPDPAIDFANSPFYLNTGLIPWKDDLSPRRAGVNSFGLGGTNAHVILEEYPGVFSKNLTAGTDPQKTFDYLFLMSAKTQTALEKMKENMGRYLMENPGVPLDDVAYTLMIGRRVCPYRWMTVCSDSADAVSKLTATAAKTSNLTTVNEERPIIFMFPGLGAQYTDMGLDLYQTYPLFREAMDHCFEILNSLGYDLKKRIFLSRSDRSYKSNIDEFDIAQLALFVFEYALAKLLVSWGIKPQAMIGYSFGEYAAACLSGVLTPTDALKLIVIRGKYIDKIPPGAMVSIPLQAEQLKTILSRFPQLSLAIDNGPSCIAAGPLSDVIVFEEAMKKEKRMCIRIQGVRALHAKMMDPILAEFTAAASKEITPGVPMIPYISNVTGGWITAADAADPAYWARHLNHTVKFSDGIQQLMKLENAVFLEIGPGRDLSNLLVRHIEGKPGFKTLDLVKGAGQDRPDNYVLLNRLGKLWLWGIPIDWRRFYAGTERYRVSLPGYPFERRAFPTAMDFDKNFARVFAQYFQDSQAGKPGASMEDIAVPDASDAGQEPSVRPLLETDYQSPRDEIEQSLARIWSKFFGFEPIGIDDNFFELGGDSLKAVIVLKRIQEDLAVEVPLERFLKGPIIRTLAKWIKDNSRDALRERAFSLFSPIRPSASAAADLQKYVEQPVILLNEAPQTQKKIFCFPSALAHGMVYKTLSSMIPGYSFYSFNFIQDEDRVDQYLDIITTLQPAGPYLLFEYSAGVKITFEVAEALEKRGFAVSDIILVDSFWPGDRMDPEVPEAVIKGLEKYHEELDAVFLQDQVIRRVRAYRRYFTLPTRPGVVNANIHLILSEENMGMPRARCWEPFTTKNAVIYQGHGPHDDMLRPGFVEKNAEIVRQILAKSDSN